jgi:hypothetical protein
MFCWAAASSSVARLFGEASGEPMGADDKPDKAGVCGSLFSVSVNDELHLLAGAFELS